MPHVLLFPLPVASYLLLKAAITQRPRFIGHISNLIQSMSWFRAIKQSSKALQHCRLAEVFPSGKYKSWGVIRLMALPNASN